MTEEPSRGERVIDLDVVRAVALIGVCVMNYHGYLNGTKAATDDSFWGRVFDPWTGPLSTRFAATFVTVAGMGISLLSRRSTGSRDREAISADRWTLLRRGIVLFAFGYFLDWVWPGTILFFYGAYFIAGAFLFTFRSRWLAVVGVVAALGAAGIQRWALHHPARWLLEGESESTRSPRDLLFDTFVRGTHPLLPWLAFLCLGIILGRMVPWRAETRVQLAFAGVLCVITGYGLAGRLPWDASLQTTHPFDRGLLYVLTAAGTAVTAIAVIGAIAQLTARSPVTQALAVTGRTTLTLYVLHVLVFNAVVHWWGWIDEGQGLGAALLFALAFWLFAIAFANAWHRWQSLGPLEWAYRRFSR